MSNCAQHPDFKGAMGYCPRCRIAELEAELAAEQQQTLSAIALQQELDDLTVKYVARGKELAALKEEVSRLRLRSTAVVESNSHLGVKKPSLTDCYGINARLLWLLRKELIQEKGK